jgi:hypothetical protein
LSGSFFKPEARSQKPEINPFFGTDNIIFRKSSLRASSQLLYLANFCRKRKNVAMFRVAPLIPQNENRILWEP